MSVPPFLRLNKFSAVRNALAGRANCIAAKVSRRPTRYGQEAEGGWVARYEHSVRFFVAKYTTQLLAAPRVSQSMLSLCAPTPEGQQMDLESDGTQGTADKTRDSRFKPAREPQTTIPRRHRDYQ